MTTQDLVRGAVKGLMVAMLIDAHAFQKSQDKLTGDRPPWNYKLMLSRYMAGAVIGALTAYDPSLSTVLNPA